MTEDSERKRSITALVKAEETGERGARTLRVHSVPTTAEQLRMVVEIVAIVAAGLWALYTFVYMQRIVPLSEPASFSVPTVVEQGSTVNGVAFLTIHKRLENTGDVPIDIAAEALSVYGERLVHGSARYSGFETPTNARLSGDVPRRQVALLFSFAKLRNGAIHGNQLTYFFTLPHTSVDETFLVAVPVKSYPVILVKRRDFVRKAPIVPKIDVKIVKDRFGAYDVQSGTPGAPPPDGEYDSEYEYAIRQQ
ncbi:MAG: hypothetical protein WBW76_17235 [Candidatus Cybelea sp.]